MSWGLTNSSSSAPLETALLDSACATIDETDADINGLDEARRPAVVMYVMFTDGMENASVRQTSADLRARIEAHRHWEFLYLGAHAKAFHEAASLGIRSDRMGQVSRSKAGISTGFEGVGTVLTYAKRNQHVSYETEPPYRPDGGSSTS